MVCLLASYQKVVLRIGHVAKETAVLLEPQFYQNIQKCSCSYWVRECSTSAGSVMIQILLETGKPNISKDGNALEK